MNQLNTTLNLLNQKNIILTNSHFIRINNSPALEAGFMS
jgi:hypothetical protein